LKNNSLFLEASAAEISAFLVDSAEARLAFLFVESRRERE